MKISLRVSGKWSGIRRRIAVPARQRQSFPLGRNRTLSQKLTMSLTEQATRFWTLYIRRPVLLKQGISRPWKVPTSYPLNFDPLKTR